MSVHGVGEPRALLRRMFQAAIDAAQPALCVPRHLPQPPRGQRRPAQIFNNRSLEKLFQKYHSVKFFLTRDHLREVIVRR